MKDLSSIETLAIPEGVTVQLKSRVVTVEGPRGKLVKAVKHIQMDMQLVSESDIDTPERQSRERQRDVGSFQSVKRQMEMEGDHGTRFYAGYGTHDYTKQQDSAEAVRQSEFSGRIDELRILAVFQAEDTIFCRAGAWRTIFCRKAAWVV